MEIPLRLKYRTGMKSRHPSRSSFSGVNKKKVANRKHPPQRPKTMLVDGMTGHKLMVYTDEVDSILASI